MKELCFALLITLTVLATAYGAFGRKGHHKKNSFKDVLCKGTVDPTVESGIEQCQNNGTIVTQPSVKAKIQKKLDKRNTTCINGLTARKSRQQDKRQKGKHKRDKSKGHHQEKKTRDNSDYDGDYGVDNDTLSRLRDGLAALQGKFNSKTNPTQIQPSNKGFIGKLKEMSAFKKCVSAIDIGDSSSSQSSSSGSSISESDGEDSD